MRRDVFQAIADPTRRDIIGLLAQRPLNLNAVADNFGISRPAISRHIKILAECGIIIIQQQGRERICEIRIEKLDDVLGWIEQCHHFWKAKLDALEQYLETVPKAKKHFIKNK